MTQTKAELLETKHQGDIRLGDANSSHYVGFKAPATVSSSLVWTLPAADGSANQFLQTNASGVLGWGTADVSSAMPLTGGTFTGDVTFDGATAGRDIVFDRSDNAFEFADNAKATFGSSADLSISHDGFTSNIVNTSGTLNFGVNNFVVKRQGLDETMLSCQANAAVSLYYDNAVKFATTATGIAITGAATVSTDLTVTGDLTVSGTTTTINTQTLDVEDKNVVIGKVSSPSDTTADGGGWTLKGATDKTFNWVNSTDAWTSSEHIHLGDSKILKLGTDTDAQLTHTGSYGSLNVSTGYFVNDIAGDWYVRNSAGGENRIIAKNDGAVELYHDNSKKIETTAAGVTVTGTVTATSFSGSGANLTNLPAGGNTVDLVADGAIAAGKPCIIKSNGKVAQVQTVNSADGPTSFSEFQANSSFAPSSLCIAQALGSQWAVMAYANNSSTANLRLRAYNWSTGSSSSEYHLNNGNGLDGTGKLSGLLYCTTRNKFVLSWVANWSGSSSTQFVTFDINTSTGALSNFTKTELGSNTRTHDIEYCGGGKFFSCHRLMSNNTARIIGPHTINSNGSITINTSELDFVASDTSTHIARMEFNSDYSKFVIGYVRSSNSNAYARCGTWNGSGGAGSGGISLGSELTISTGLGGLDWQNGFDLCCEKTSGKWVAVYGMSNGSRAKCISNSSGTTIAQGSEVTINGTNPDGRFAVTDNGTVENVVTWAGKYSSGFGCANLIISGTNTIAVSAGPNQVNSNGPEAYPISMYTCVDGIPDSGADNVLLFNRREGSSDPRAYRATVAAVGTNLSAQNRNFLGFAEDAISDGNTGSIKLTGNVVGNLSGLTAGTMYSIEGDGTFDTGWTTYDVGVMAVSSTSGLIVRRD